MNVFAIGDLHLPGGQDKPMDVFGEAWKDHPRVIRERWLDVVGSDDVVLVPGDISWAMTLEQAQEDLDYLGALPGRIVLIRGNHDYWWNGIGKVREALPANVEAVQNDHVTLPNGWAVCGSRGWTVPGGPGYDPEVDDRLYEREQQRLELSLQSALRAGAEHIFVMLHYPPVNDRHEPSAFTRLFEKFPVRHCIYGHMHGPSQRRAMVGERDGIRYHMVACDGIGFKPVFIDSLH